MNILNLRQVYSFEIPDSYRGILRISPNKISDDSSVEDDPTELLLDPSAKVHLSDSSGNTLPITFKTQIYSTVVLGREYTHVDLVHLGLEIDNLFVANSLNIKSNLLITPGEKKFPLIFGNGSQTVSYPIEAPINSGYFNFENKLNFNSKLSYEENVNSLSINHELYSDENKWQWSKVNNEYQYKHIFKASQYYKVPILKRRDYILGVCPDGTYKYPLNDNLVDLSDSFKNSSSSKHTQLSWIPADAVINQNIERFASGIIRTLDGRYFNLNPPGDEVGDNSSNNLAKILFGENCTKEDLNSVAPILGSGVQSGTIHYNAIPARRYFFHLLRRYNTSNRLAALKNKNSSLTSAYPSKLNTMNNITLNYALCDGKLISEKPNIDYDSFKNKWSNIHAAIANSFGNTDKDIKTPPLFEMDQLSPRYIRGLNWLRIKESGSDDYYDGSTVLSSDTKSTDYNTFINNRAKYIKYDSSDDAGNLVKDIHDVGMYYFNTDSDLQKNWKHCHLLFDNRNSAIYGDSLFEEKDVFIGKHTKDLPSDSEAWMEYVKGNTPYYKGSLILKTAHAIYGLSDGEIKRVQNYPIAVEGGSTSIFWNVYAWKKYARHRKFGKCYGHRHAVHGPYSIKDGYYKLKHTGPASDANSSETDKVEKWRLISSLPQQNKYGSAKNNFNSAANLSYATFGDTTVYLDDSLGNPPSINFIPLMKI